jgi:hypothetical protein
MADTRPRSFKQLNTANRDMQQLQANIEAAIKGVIAAPLLNGRLESNVTLTAGNTALEHRLDRVPAGYIVADKNAAATIYTVSKDDRFLTLNSSVACVITIWYF